MSLDYLLNVIGFLEAQAGWLFSSSARSDSRDELRLYSTIGHRDPVTWIRSTPLYRGLTAAVDARVPGGYETARRALVLRAEPIKQPAKSGRSRG